MKKRAKRPACLNCGRPLLRSDNFCPSCGQENTNHIFGVRSLLDDFFSNYFSFDSKLSRSTLPFLVKPGYLTKRFIEGKRVSFVNPLRLYLIITFVFFFLLSALIDGIVVENRLSLQAAFENDMPPPKLVVPNADSLVVDPNDMPRLDALENANLSKADSTRPAPPKQEWDDIFLETMKNDSLTDVEVMEKLDMNKESTLQQLFVHQFRKVLHKDIDVFLPYLIKNLSIMMFLLLPVFAFFLYVLFRKREPYYISHVIHALHLHAFSFLILILVVGLELMVDASSWFGWGAFWLITLYAFLSIKKVYQQRWLKTFFKFNLLGFFYFMALFVAVLIEVGISFMLF